MVGTKWKIFSDDYSEQNVNGSCEDFYQILEYIVVVQGTEGLITVKCELPVAVEFSPQNNTML